MAYVRKTVDRWDIETNYGYGWEVEDCEYTRAEAVKRLKEYQAAKGYTNEAVFIDWCQGLPSILDTCYFYNRSAVADLGAILQQSERERARYTESQAEQLLTHLIYQELVKGARK